MVSLNTSHAPAISITLASSEMTKATLIGPLAGGFSALVWLVDKIAS
jgi:hypothetical protein